MPALHAYIEGKEPAPEAGGRPGDAVTQAGTGRCTAYKRETQTGRQRANLVHRPGEYEGFLVLLCLLQPVIVVIVSSATEKKPQTSTSASTDAHQQAKVHTGYVWTMVQDIPMCTLAIALARRKFQV